MKTIKAPIQYRAAEIIAGAVNEEARTVEFSFSSEAPVERFFGSEILDHSPQSVRLGRIQNGGPVLVDHDPADHVGVVESVSIDADRVGRVRAKIGRSARAMEIFNDITDGIRRSISVGYRVHEMKLEKRGDGADVYRVTDWEPLEVSLVAIPADASVGIGRSDAEENDISIIEPTEVTTMTTETTLPQAEAKQAPVIDVREIERNARDNEVERVRSIQKMGEGFHVREMADKAIADGQPAEAFRVKLIDHLQATRSVPSADIGMSEREIQQFSFTRAINALSNPTDQRAQKAAAYEFEASRAACEKMGKETRGILVPADVLKRDLSVGTTTAGGHTVSTDLLAQSFIDLLRNRAYMMQMGTVLSGLNGNVAIPRQTGGATAYWVAEAGAPTESQQAFDQVTMVPRTLGAFTDFSRKLMLQSSIDIEAFIRRDLATVLAIEIDRSALHGSGSSNQPTGIASTAGIGSVAGGTNGLAPTWANIIALETEVAIDNADIGSLAYVTNAKVRGKLKGTEKASTTGMFVWGENSTPLNGYNAVVTNQVASNLVKGSSGAVCSAIFFGNWADLLIGMWGGLDLLVDPYTASTTGTVRVTALQDIDIAVRHPESFAAMLDALTT
jgi:HK97 family phage major capsid protein/HK97 family phage prohead protease